MRKTVYLQYSTFQKGRNSYKNWLKLTTLELDLQYSKKKSYAKFQLDMSKNVGEKCGKLHITYILSFKRGITPSKIDAKWRHSNLICSTLKQSDVQNFSSICQSMYEKSVENMRTETRTDGRRVGRTESRTENRTDGHHHTIIRPVWRRAYKNSYSMLYQHSNIIKWSSQRGGDGRGDGPNWTFLRK